jgi:hypothetical protein
MDDKIANLANMTNGWISHFFSADRELKWHFAELEHSLWLTPNTLLVGRIDAGGETADGELFFGEWKTANPRERNTWKQVWRMNPQSLTYGVLGNDYFHKTMGRSCSQFTVRKAFKSNPPTFDHAWYSYNDEELAHWRLELISIANEIRYYGKERLKEEGWPTNWDSCFKFGINYACPHFEEGCSKMKWDIPVDTMRRVSHLDIERRLNETNAIGQDMVILDATRVKTWLTCRERFRREYVENVATPMTEALNLGIQFHDVMGQHYTQLVQQQKGNENERSTTAV